VMLSKPTWLRGYTEVSRAFLSARVAIVAEVFVRNWQNVYEVLKWKKLLSSADCRGLTRFGRG
jgi:hypothetical protein